MTMTRFEASVHIFNAQIRAQHELMAAAVLRDGLDSLDPSEWPSVEQIRENSWEHADALLDMDGLAGTKDRPDGR